MPPDVAGQTPAAVFVRIASRPIPRVSRMMRVARELGYATTFCGALRESGLPRREALPDLEIVRLGPFFPLLNGRKPFLYTKSVFLFNVALYKYLRRERPEVVHASDAETMLACVLYRIRFQRQLIYNIHDNLAQRYAIPSFVAGLLNLIEGLLVKFADVTLVPEPFRRDALPKWCRRSVTVVRNTPEDPGYAEPGASSATVRIFFAGWIDWGRGLRSLMTLAAEHPDIEIAVAGEGSSEIIATIRESRGMRYLGFLDHESVVEETRRCHCVAALYDPARPINRFAASNKLAEALAVGRPVILNQELAILDSLPDEDCLIVTKYCDADLIGDKIKGLVRDDAAYRQACVSARRIYEDQYAWEPVRKKIRQAFVMGSTSQ